MPDYKLLIFDWDGTLVDSAGTIVASMQQAIADLSLPARTDRQIAELIGLGLDDVMGRLYPEYELEELKGLLEAYRSGFGNTPVHYSPLFEGVEAALEEFRASGFRLAVATGKSRRGLNRALEGNRAGHWFEATACADETANKPDPAMLHKLLSECGIGPEQALMVGDTEFDILMAHNGEVDCLGVLCGVHDRQRLEKAGPLAVIDHVSSLSDWINR